MKNIIQSLRTVAFVLSIGASSLLAQSCAAVTSFGNASVDAVKASGEVAASAAAAAKGSAQVGSAVLAVPVWSGGAMLEASGEIVTAVGNAAKDSGHSTAHAAEKMWDFGAGSDPAERPALDRQHGVPPAPAKTSAAKPISPDPTPAEAIKRL
jgi:hypothetical protein